MDYIRTKEKKTWAMKVKEKSCRMDVKAPRLASQPSFISHGPRKEVNVREQHYTPKSAQCQCFCSIPLGTILHALNAILQLQNIQ